MNPEHWKRARALIERALELPPGERAAFVRRETGTTSKLGEMVLRYLRSSDPCDDFLESPLPAGAAEPVAAGDRIGAYRIVRMIGAGGMGSVYEATQDRPTRTVYIRAVRVESAQSR